MKTNVAIRLPFSLSTGRNKKAPRSSSEKFLTGDFAILFFLFFFSGMCALIYEITWTRRLTLIFGNTVYSVSTVLVAFMGGFALGSILFGRFVDRRQDPLRTYGLMEIGIGASALLVPSMLSALNPAYRLLFSEIGSSLYLMNLTRFVLSAAVLIIPTTFMGATLPILSKIVVRRIEKRGLGIGSLYSINTLGAMVGCFLAGFVLLGWLGITRSEHAAAVINVSIGLIALTLQRRIGYISSVEGETSLGQSLEEPKYGRSAARFVLFMTGISGMLALGYEVLWTRILVFLLGSSIYSFSMILVVYLFGLTAGSLLSAKFIDNTKRPLQVFGWLEIFIGLSAFAGFLLFRKLPFEEYTLSVKPLNYLTKNFLSTFVVVLIPTLMMGATFPAAVRVYARSLGNVGRQTGSLYAVNTTGGIVGSFAAGFLLIPALGSKNSLMLVILLSIAAGFSLLYVSMKREDSNNLNWLAGAFLILPMLGFPFSGDLMEQLSMRFLKSTPGKVIAFEEDATAAVAVIEIENNYRFLAVNGVAMTILCTETQLMAHLPIALSSDPHNVLAICFGMGSTFVSARKAGMNVDFVELCPDVVDMFEYFQGDPSRLKETGVGKIIADGRNYVLLSDKTYDLITIDPPPPPWSAGTVNLYTKEFYELCKARLTPQGIVCQWLPTIHSCFTERQFKMLLRTFLEVFPHTTVWSSPGKLGAFLIATPERLSIDKDSFIAYFGRPVVRSDLSLYSLTPVDGQGVLSLLALDEDAAKHYVRKARVMHDDNPWIEFPLFKIRPKDKIMEVEMLAGKK